MKKNRIFHIFIIYFLIFLSGCTMSKHYLKQGRYDAATREAVKKLKKNPTKEKHILVLKEAFPKANEIDNNKIIALHKAGQPDRWDKIFKIYSNLEIRQVLVENVTPLYLGTEKIEFPHVDYDQKIVEAKVKAASYYYSHGKKLLTENNKFSARKAHEEFKIIKEYTNAYTDIEGLLADSYKRGLSHIVLAAVNNTQFSLPDDFLFNLIDLNIDRMNSEWINYYTRDVRNGNYDAFIYVNLRIVDISPERISTTENTVTETVEDGWEYQKDSQGRIMRDTAGRMIKITKYKTLTCKVYETHQIKQAHIEGVVQFVDAESGVTFRSVPVAADQIFENFYATANGELKILSKETRRKLNSRPLPFPPDIQMMYDASEALKNAIYNAIRNQRTTLIQKY